MSDIARIVETLREEARHPRSPGEQRSAALEVLRREIPDMPRDELLAELSKIREALAPADRDSEAANLWEALAVVAGQAREASASAAAGAGGSGVDLLLREVLGPDWKGGATAAAEARARLGLVIRRIVDTLTRCDEALRRLNLDLRTHMMLEGRSGGTVVGLKLEEPIRKLIALAVLGTGDVAEVEKRVEGIAKSGVLFHNAHVASNRQAWETIRNRLDPQSVQKEHGGKAWEAYRRLYHNEFLDFGAEFEEQFVTKPFLQEYFRTLDKVK